MSTLQRLQRLLAETLRIIEDDMKPDSTIAQLFDRSGGDSLDRIEFIMAVEEEFPDLEIPDAEADRRVEWIGSLTVQQLAEQIEHWWRPLG